MPSGTQFQCLCNPPFQGPTCAEQDPCQPNQVNKSCLSSNIFLLNNFNFISVKTVVNVFKWVQVLCADAHQDLQGRNANFVTHVLLIR